MSEKTQQIKNQIKKQNIKPIKSKRNKRFLLTIFILGIITSIFLQKNIISNYESYSFYLFNQPYSMRSQFSALNLIKSCFFYFCILQFFITQLIMSIRIIFQYIQPVCQKDPLSITLLNRILMNNMEQGIIFFGLYVYLLFGQNYNISQYNVQRQRDIKFDVCLALLFLIGRVVFNVLYVLATVVNVSTLRSLGFAFTFGVNLLILEQTFNLNLGLRNLMF